MTEHENESRLGEALASYQPSTMTPATWERFRDDALSLVASAGHTERRAAQSHLSRLVAYLADLAEAQPNATVADLLDRTQVEGYLTRLAASGASPGHVTNVQWTLNVLLRVKDGHRTSTVRPTAAATRAEMAEWVTAAVRYAGGSHTDRTDWYVDDDGHSLEPYVNDLTGFGVVTGKGDGLYGPDEPLSRAQMATFLSRALSLAVEAAG